MTAAHRDPGFFTESLQARDPALFGAVRDVAELRAAPMGVRALALVPMPTSRAGQGQRDVVLNVAACTVRPEEWLYADADGMVVSDRPLHAIS